VARADFLVSIPGSCTLKNRDGFHREYEGLESKTAFETSSGAYRRKPKGWIPPTGYSLLHRNVIKASGSLDASHPSFPTAGGVYSGVVGSIAFNSYDHFDFTMPESDAYDPTLVSKSQIAARLKLKGSKVDLGVAFGERKQTARLLGDTASQLAKSIVQLKHGKVRDAMRTLGLSSKKGLPRGSNVPQKWLELQYGWKPLLSDVYGAADALSKRQKSDWRITAKATRSSKGERTHKFNSWDLGTCRASYRASAFTRIDALPENEAVISLASLGVTNPLTIGWELLPFSFVVDWFIPIGDYLQSLDALLGYTDVYSSTSYLVKAKWVGQGENGEVPGTGGFMTKNSYLEQKTIVSLERTAQAGVPMPMPSIKDARSLGHMANGLALLSQAFGR
jgi:hypothetical protein